MLTPGAYPEVSLADAREKRDEAKKLLRASRDPRHAARRGRVVGDGSSTRSFEAVSRDCHGLHPGRWKPVQAQDVITSLERDIFEDLGAMPMAEMLPRRLALTARRPGMVRFTAWDAGPGPTGRMPTPTAATPDANIQLVS
ncbi:MAG: integrase arm-type DNA-binding domain-containing protein [Citromicrobium sp.]|uniref:integrase arm-type DNA-binding domain-containing protein n=1 Tax=Citromicrobium bathyomarinum TaxID=72174 RepID=UPI001A3E7F97|nr:integrase arm-type DNA-binding domain-containing protein [Citromicrobium sp.]